MYPTRPGWGNRKTSSNEGGCGGGHSGEIVGGCEGLESEGVI